MLLIGSFGLSVTGLAAQPNILFLFADDLGRYGSAYADKNHPSPNDIVQTPAFDRIAKEGAIF
jgi:arylsulfatase A-like enzyme